MRQTILTDASPTHRPVLQSITIEIALNRSAFTCQNEVVTEFLNDI